VRQKRCIHIGTECFIAVGHVSRKTPRPSSAGFHLLAGRPLQRLQSPPRQARALLDAALILTPFERRDPTDRR